MKIGVITTSYPRHEGDFAGGFVESNVRALLADGHTVDVLAAVDPEAGDDERPAWVEATTPGVRQSTTERTGSAGRLRIARIGARRPLHGLARGSDRLFYGAGAPEVLESGAATAWVQAAGFCAGLCDHIRAWSGSWDEIQAHWLVPSALVALAVVGDRASSRARLPVRAHAHSGDVALLERIPGGRALASWLARHLTGITFASDDLGQRFARLVGGSDRIIAECRLAPAASLRPWRCEEAPAATPLRRIPIRARPGSATDDPARGAILSVGRLVPIKGFDLLLKAVALSNGGAGQLYRTRDRPRRVVILGDGPERERLAHLAARLELDLHLPGFVPRKDVGRWMRAAALYVQPSRTLPSGRTEGMPVATLEAIEQGAMVLASDSGGLAELPRHTSRARLFRAGDYHALSRLLADFAGPAAAPTPATQVSGA